MMEPVVMKHRRTTLERAEKFISPHHFTDVNLHGRQYPETHKVTFITHWAAPQDVYTPYEEAVKGVYSVVHVGQQFGPTWATHWFRVEVELPEMWAGREAVLRWNSNSEALVWVDGQPRMGLCKDYDRLDFPLATCVQKDNLRFTVYIEMACNGMFGAGSNGMIQAPNPDLQYTLSCCEAAVFDRRVYNLVRDVEMLYDIAKHLPEGSERGYQALYTVNKLINTCDVANPDTYQRCHDIAAKFTRQKNGDSQHTIHAMGHAHMDTAWLWRYDETKRKCARSWSCTLRLMEKYPEFTFTCSQAQQFDWVKEQYPSIYADIQKFVKAGQFIPVGGSWVEMDGNIPSGESFIRQFLYGQRFFQREFGATCKEFWLPDTFGYSGQLPQIMKHCGMSRFLTQKMSWNLVNKFPHHTFWWEGIDGSRVLSHFPPGDCYTMMAKIEEILKTKDNFRDKGRSNTSVFLFGFGDGGNGPSEDMIERLSRIQDVDGLPKVKMSTPDAYFDGVEREDGGSLCRWAGELYLELHNGTYTTQARVKKMNRKCEFLLHDMELLSALALASRLGGGAPDYVYPAGEVSRLWKLVLLNQFHDVLPGSSIGLVYEDAHKFYDEVMELGTGLLHQAMNSCLAPSNTGHGTVVWNTHAWDRSEVVSIGPGMSQLAEANMCQADAEGNTLCYVRVPSCGYSTVQAVEHAQPVTYKEDGAGIVLQNEHLVAHIDDQGRVVKLYLTIADRDFICVDRPANQFVIYDDIPLYWDAWDVMDYHLETRKPLSGVQNMTLVDKGPLRVSIQFHLRISESSHIEQTISLDAGSPYLSFHTKVDWHENHKFLKVEFPTSIHTRHATYDIQCGHLERPTHANTSWDTARFEVCGHKWADLSEHGYGLAILNESKYGHSAVDNTLRLSLLRSPKAPDKFADMELHTFAYAMMPHSGTFQEAGVIKAAYALNCPLRMRQQDLPAIAKASYFSLDNQQVVMETIKKAEDHDRSLILRLYESFGGTCATTLVTSLPFKSITKCSGLEVVDIEPDTDLKLTTDGDRITFCLKPFQILTLMLEL